MSITSQHFQRLAKAIQRKVVWTENFERHY